MLSAEAGYLRHGARPFQPDEVELVVLRGEVLRPHRSREGRGSVAFAVCNFEHDEVNYYSARIDIQ